MRKLLYLALTAALTLTATPALAARGSAPGYTIMTMDKNTGAQWWSAVYLRALPSGAAWLDGDRAGYKCAYGFLADPAFITPANPEGIVGRFTFTRIDGAAAYAKVNDSGMAEGARYFDGSKAPASAGNELGQCPAASLAYEPYTGPTQLPTVTYNAGARVLESRVYANLKPGAGVTFRLVETTPTKVTVVAHVNGAPVIAVYYESMVPGVTMATG